MVKHYLILKKTIIFTGLSLALLSCANKTEQSVTTQTKEVVPQFDESDYIELGSTGGFLLKTLGAIDMSDNKQAKRVGDCYYASTRPNVAFSTKNRNVLGITITDTGLVVGMVPKTKFQGELDKVIADRNQWKSKIAAADIQNFEPVGHTGTGSSSLDIALKRRHHIAFKLFPSDWNFANEPFELKDPIPLVSSPFSVDERAGTKIIHLNYYRGDSLEKKCRYPFSLNVNSSDSVFNTLLKIDPIINDDGGGVNQ